MKILKDVKKEAHAGRHCIAMVFLFGYNLLAGRSGKRYIFVKITDGNCSAPYRWGEQAAGGML
jgi:hypothetical protein